MAHCPCGSGFDLDECCGPIIDGTMAAPTAEALMRSRFSAYVQGNIDHIENTQAKDGTEDFDRAATESWADSIEWTSLEITGTSDGGENDDMGVVEFTALFKQDGKEMAHRERSNFCREDGRWVYLDGIINPKGDPVRVEKVGRNQPCPCGSGKKFKKCCGA